MKEVYPDAADCSNADEEGYSLPAYQWILYSNTNNLSAYFIRNLFGYIKMEEKSEKMACNTSLDLLPTWLFLFMVPFATNLLLLLFLFLTGTEKLVSGSFCVWLCFNSLYTSRCPILNSWCLYIVFHLLSSSKLKSDGFQFKFYVCVGEQKCELQVQLVQTQVTYLWSG